VNLPDSGKAVIVARHRQTSMRRNAAFVCLTKGVERCRGRRRRALRMMLFAPTRFCNINPWHSTGRLAGSPILVGWPILVGLANDGSASRCDGRTLSEVELYRKSRRRRALITWRCRADLLLDDECHPAQGRLHYPLSRPSLGQPVVDSSRTSVPGIVVVDQNQSAR